MSLDSNHSEQLERYLSGQMSPEEAHAFERGALDDPFLAEALEGFEVQHPKQLKADLEGLRGKLKAEKSKTPWGFMKIAAAVALLIVAGFSVWLITSDNVQMPDELAIQEQEKEEPAPKARESSTEEPSTHELDTEETSDKDPIEKSSEAFLTDEALAQQEGKPTARDNSDEGTEALEISEKQEKETRQAPMQKKTVAAESPQIQLAEVAIEEEIEVALDVAVTEETVVESIVFEEAPEAESEAYESFAAKTLQQNNSSAIIRLRGQSTLQTTASPIIGWKAYKQYLSDSIRYPKDMLEKGLEERVMVRADISASGRVDTVYLVNGLHPSFVQEAIRLVSEGPLFEADTIQRRAYIPVIFKLK